MKSLETSTAIIVTAIPALPPFFSRERRTPTPQYHTKEQRSDSRYNNYPSDPSKHSIPKQRSDTFSASDKMTGCSATYGASAESGNLSREDMMPLVPVHGIGRRVEVSVV